MGDPGPMDFLNLLYLPLMFITAKEARQDWASLWDARLTPRDRYMLQRLVIFWLLPIVVLCHELGHVAAVKLFGGKVAEFHYAFVWGYVVPSGIFTPDQTVWLYFSGNLVQIIIGFISLFLAFIFKSPPVVAMCVYLFFWAVGGTTIMYALMSFTGLYGDWQAIYSAHAQPLVTEIAVFHVLVVAFVLYCAYSQRGKNWYMSKTEPDWADSYKQLLSIAKSSKHAPRERVRAYLAIAELQWMHGQLDNAFETYESAIAVDPTVADPHFFKAVLLNDAQRFSDAEQELTTTYNLDWIDESLQQAAMKELQQAQDGRSQQQ
jgi:hypothetical protein